MTGSASLLEQIRQLLDAKGVREGSDPLLPQVILRPATTDEVAAVVTLCAAAGQPLIPIGGMTGLVDGLHRTGTEYGLSLERMNRIEEIDVVNRTLTAQAGCILQVAAEAAEEQELLLPLDLGARGSATIGGTVATNAGGNRVIRYGMMRDMVLGLEVVLADGTVVTSLNKMLKNNTGYDLKQWFIGAEGTLGIITRVVLRLRPLPRSQNTALVAVRDFAGVRQLLGWADARSAGTLSAYEVMWPAYYEYITREGGLHRPPLPHGSPYYVILETLGSSPGEDADSFERMLAEAFERDLVSDAVVAQTQAERNAIWEIRDDVLDLLNLGPQAIFDVSVTLDRMEDFVNDVQAGMAGREGSITVIFGHLGDCNLHVMLGSTKPETFDAGALQEMLYDAVERHRGSVSAEHGVGLAKRPYLRRSRSAEELALMRRMKRMLDPDNILNPNKIFSADAVAGG